MNRLIWNLGLAAMCMAAFSACDSKKTAKNAEPIDEEEAELVMADTDAERDVDATFADDEVDDYYDDGDEDERELTPEERERYENEVWP